ncbi:hypothetical protein EJ110_NYTH40657 [Nymphaea thermarum]|nr:hypothetical protein EJ110_NYTH40657 [Nymphaea thermarum]
MVRSTSVFTSASSLVLSSLRHHHFTARSLLASLGLKVGSRENNGVIQKKHFPAHPFVTQSGSAHFVCLNEIHNLECGVLKTIDNNSSHVEIEKALAAFDDMRFCHVHKPSVISCTRLLNVLVRRGRYEDGFSVYFKMVNSGISPTLVTFNTLLNCFCKACQIESAFAVLAVILKTGFSPSCITFTTLVDALVKSGRLDEALWLQASMFVEGCDPNESDQI